MRLALALAKLPATRRSQIVNRWSDATARLFDSSWRHWAGPGQRRPDGKWRVWLMMAGRGFGKTRAGAEWVRGLAERHGAIRIALVGATEEDVRRVMIEGEAGLLSIGHPSMRPQWEPSKGELRWRTGARAFAYSAANHERLRGPSHHAAWCDEVCKWPNGIATWDNLSMTLRAGPTPRTVVTTTPRPTPLIHRLISLDGTTVTRGRTIDNIHLPKAFVAGMLADYAGTRLGRQELEGELIEDAEGALWTRGGIEDCRVNALPPLKRVVIGVDPPAGTLSGEGGGDACGIVVAALGDDGRGYVIADASVRGRAPEGWAAAVASAATRFGADRVIAEANNGGAIVESVLLAADARLPVKRVHASRGKAARAEPVAALYAHGRVKHLGAFPALEDEMCGLIAGGGYEGPGRSPDRADALVWALTELMLGRPRRGIPQVRAV